MKYCK